VISVDDHVTHPPDLWTSRLPSRYADRAPHVERDRAKLHMLGGVSTPRRGDPDGTWADFWVYEGVEHPLSLIANSVGFEGEERHEKLLENAPVTYDDIAPGCWQQAPRLADMTANHVEASLCFPNGIPRFCGQTFYENDDKDLGLLCIKAHNDWMVEEWCAGDGEGRLLPLILVPLWSAELSADEVRRCADRGAHAVSWVENPYALGLPSMYDESRFWDPFFRACEETETVINLHIGSSSKMPATSPDSPFSVTSILMFQNSMASVLDFILSGVFERFPRLKTAFSEGQIGWLPYLIDRADTTWADPHDGGVGVQIPNPPSSYVPGHVYGCIFDDQTALMSRDLIGMDQIMFEVDYPHLAGSFPTTTKWVTGMCDKAGLDTQERYKLLRGNAISVFGLERWGISS
jgi:predicted TIM-barrel fold metal-dependent hydrolase